MENFTGKLAVITGGASGVGLAIGEALAKEGAKVICPISKQIVLRLLPRL